MNEDMILPDDFPGEETETTATPEAENINNQETTNENEATEVTPTEEASQESINEPKIRVKYNHEEKELTLEEATLLAQKGMNYDKKLEELNSLQNNPGLLYLNELANRNNTTVDELINYWKQAEEQEELNKLIQANIPEEYAKEMLESRKFRQEQQMKIKQETEAKTQQANQEREINEFLTNYPDIDVNKIPQEVWNYKKETGKSLNDSMMWHENQQLKNQIKILKQNETNRTKAPVSGVTSHGATETAQEDDFLRGFNSI